MAENQTNSETHQPASGSTDTLSVVWTISAREVTEQLTSLRFLIITLLVLGLTPLAVYVGSQDYVGRLEDSNRLAAERQNVAAGEAGKHVRGFDSPWTPENELLVLRSIRQPEPLSVLVHGLDGVLPRYWDFSPTGLVAGSPAWQPQRLADVLGQLDLEFLVRLALGLLAVLMAFDAIAGEKELGTLRAVLSQPIPRSALLAGTGDAHRAAWLSAVHRHQSLLNSVLFEDPPTLTIRNKQSSFTANRRSPPAISDLPAFVPPRRDAAEAVILSLPSLGLLLLATAIFILGGFVAFSHYDVR